MTNNQQKPQLPETTLIICPSCEQPAQVIGGTRLICPDCGLSHSRSHPRRYSENGTCLERKGTLVDWYGQLISVPADHQTNTCSHCGNRVIIDATPTPPGKRAAQIAEELTGACDTCNRTRRVAALWVPYQIPSAPREQTFGAELYLQESTSKGVVFALNRAHAQTLLDHIAVNQQRQPRSEKHARMFAVLPAWMKSAKNRPAIVKALKRLIERSSSKG